MTVTIEEIIKLLPERKNLLAMSAYQIPTKKFIKEMGLYCQGYNQALDEVAAALRKLEAVQKKGDTR